MSDRELHHPLLRMRGRDPHERGRAATPLELLFDLTFVVAFGTAADELAHLLVAGETAAGLAGFAFATFAVSWAWINFTWFASAYDTDDWVYRLTTMVQMGGVLVLALGLPAMFESLVEGHDVDNGVMVAGYVVMRVALVFQWLRAARQDPERARASHAYVVTILLAQVGWIVLLLASTSVPVMFAWAGVLVLVETAGPVVAEKWRGGTPWHAHHVAERYALMVIIALGEGLLGTMALLTAFVGPEGGGWSVDVAVLGVAGTALTFGMWWIYFILPSGAMLHARRERSFGWGYGHILLFGATVAVGAGMHAAAAWFDHHSALDAAGSVVVVAVPLAVYVLGVFGLYALLTRSLDPFHLWLLAGSAVLLVAPVLLARSGVGLAWCLLLLAATPWVTVVGYERVGHRHEEQVLAAVAD